MGTGLSTKKADGRVESVAPSQCGASKVMLQDVLAPGPPGRHHRRPDLTQADAMPPSGAFQNELDGLT